MTVKQSVSVRLDTGDEVRRAASDHAADLRSVPREDAESATSRFTSPGHGRDALTRQPYRRDIDGLRAVAVIAVLLFHCSIPGITGGYIGVDVFFVISGFLITEPLAADIADRRVSLFAFYVRRVRRIVPALLVTLMLTWLAAAWLMVPSFLVETSEAVVAASALVSNIFLWRSATYFAAASSYQPLLHTWSLSVEEQFYLVVPLLMTLAARPIRQRWWLLFGPLCLTSFALSAYATTTTATANFYLLPTRAWELGIGAFIGTVRLPLVRNRLAAELLGLAAISLILWPVFVFDAKTAFPGWNALYPCIGTMALLHIGRSARPSITQLLSTRAFVAVGLISYSLYLVHWPIISFVSYARLGPLRGWDVMAIIAVSLLLATLSWRFVEQPFRRAAGSHDPRVLFAGITASAAVCVIGIVTLAAGGFPQRFPSFVVQNIAGHADWKPDTCFMLSKMDYRRWSPTECTRVATGPERVLLWGDSFAAQYVPGLIANASAVHATILQYTAAACLPVLHSYLYAQRRCRAFEDHLLDVITEQKIARVLVAARWSGYEPRDLAEVASTLSELEQRGVRVSVIGQSPEFPVDVQVLSFLRGSRDEGAVNRWPLRLHPDFNRMLAEELNHEIIDPLLAFCVHDLCEYQNRGQFLFADAVHYSAVGSAQAVLPILALHVDADGEGKPRLFQ